MRASAAAAILLFACAEERTAGDGSFERTREAIARAREAVPPGNYRIDVERLWVGESDAQGLSALLGWIDSSVAVAAGGATPGPGLHVGVAKEGFLARFDAVRRSVRSAKREQSFIVTAPGRHASLSIGETRYLEPFTFGGVLYEGWIPGGRFVGTAVEAIVETAGEGRVRLSLTPSFSGIGPGGTVRATELSTTVEAPLGTSIFLGSEETTRHSVATALFSRRTESGREVAVVLATVRGG